MEGDERCLTWGNALRLRWVPVKAHKPCYLRTRTPLKTGQTANRSVSLSLGTRAYTKVEVAKPKASITHNAATTTML